MDSITFQVLQFIRSKKLSKIYIKTAYSEIFLLTFETQDSTFVLKLVVIHFSPSYCVLTGWGPPSSLPMGTGCSFSRGKAVGE
jgi:hypothetical protein